MTNKQINRDPGRKSNQGVIMKNLLIALTMLVVSSSAFAVVYVPYGQWRSLPYCGGQTRLICDDVPYARSTNSCNIEFRNSYGCSEIKLYVGHDFHPTYNTSVFPMQGSFYVDNSKVNWFSDSFRTYMSSGSGTYYDQVVYQFRY